MEHEAWQRELFAYPGNIPTMLSQEEILYLYWLCRAHWAGQGTVVEIGPWLGGSTICLAAGMQDSNYNAQGKLHTYDNFIWREFMASRAKLPLKTGQSFYSFFLSNVSSYEHIIRPHIRALPDEEIRGDVEAHDKRFREEERVRAFELESSETIEILFLDGAKSLRGIRFLLGKVVKQLKPFTSYIVCQDYKYWGTYWVPMTMAILKDFVRPAHNVLSGTTVAFQLISKIPTEIIEQIENHISDVPTARGLELLDLGSSLLVEDNDHNAALNVRLGKVAFLSHQGDVLAAIEKFREIQESYSVLSDFRQLERARNYLGDRVKYPIRRPARIWLGLYMQKLLKRARLL